MLGDGAEDTVGRGLGPAEGTESIEFVGANAHIGPRNGFSILRTLCKPRKISVVRNLLGGIIGGWCVRHCRAGPWSRREKKVLLEFVGADIMSRLGRFLSFGIFDGLCHLPWESLSWFGKKGGKEPAPIVRIGNETGRRREVTNREKPSCEMPPAARRGATSKSAPLDNPPRRQ